MCLISIIMPVLNEGDALGERLRALQPLRRRGCELIVVDGGSADGSVMIAKPLADRVLTARRGRAAQMNAGARVARGDVLWFLHADSEPPAGADQLICAALRRPGPEWGRFDVRLSGRALLLRVVETLMNLRSRLTGIATGDQGIFVRAALFARVGGYPDIALMEDIALSGMLRRSAPAACLGQRLVASSRRWERRGIWRTILLMWCLRLAYVLGADPTRLERIYYGH